MTDLPDIYPESIGEEMYSDAAPLVGAFGDPDTQLRVYMFALASMLQPIDDICKDGPNGEPGWSQIFDLTRMKTSWLPWAGQLNGYFVPAQPASQTLAEYDAIQRDRIVTRRADTKGTTDRLVLDVKDQLNDPKRVIVRERADGNHASIFVYVYHADVATSDAEVTKVALAAKLAGLIMTFIVLPDEATYNEVVAANATYAAVLSDFEDYNALLTDT